MRVCDMCLEMGLFGLLNYEDFVLKTVVKSQFAEDTFTIMLTYMLTSILRFHLSIVICILLQNATALDYVMPIIVGVVLSLQSNSLYNYVNTNETRHRRIVKYFIDSYSRENFVRWKRYILAGLVAYTLAVLALTSITNAALLLSTAQTVITFVICDMLEHDVPVQVWRRFKRWWYKPKWIKSKDGTRVLHTTNVDTAVPVPVVIQQIPEALPARPPTPPIITRRLSGVPESLSGTPTRTSIPSVPVPDYGSDLSSEEEIFTMQDSGVRRRNTVRSGSPNPMSRSPTPPKYTAKYSPNIAYI